MSLLSNSVPVYHSSVNLPSDAMLSGIDSVVRQPTENANGKQNVAVKWMALLLRIQEVPGWNLSPETDSFNIFCCFLQSHKKNSGMVHQIKPRPLPSTSFSIHNLLIILSLDTIYPELLKATLSKLHISLNKYNYYVFGHYPSSCLYLETPSCLFFETQRFGDWILSPSSGKTYSVGPNLKTETESSLRNVVSWKINRTVFLYKDRTMDNVQKHNSCTNVPSSQTFRSYSNK
jgi:hypothetical protein